MRLLEKIKNYSQKNSDKKIAMFVDMDGVIASFDIDLNGDIVANKPGYFLNKRPLLPVINMLEEVSKISNIDLYILSACVYKEQAEEKVKWLERYAPFFKKENQIFVIKEVVNYDKDTKPEIKTQNIVNVLQKEGYDLAVYLEDEIVMLRRVHRLLKDKIMLIHISEAIE